MHVSHNLLVLFSPFDKYRQSKIKMKIKEKTILPTSNF